MIIEFVQILNEFMALCKKIQLLQKEKVEFESNSINSRLNTMIDELERMAIDFDGKQDNEMMKLGFDFSEFRKITNRGK